MILNFPLLRLSLILLFVFLFPFIQKQWFNLSLFNTNNFSFYSILYYLSGFVCPSLVSINSINKFTYYRFQNSSEKRLIKGKKLLLLILFTLIPLSIIIANYFYINLNLFTEIFFIKSFPTQVKYSYINLFVVFIILTLIFRKSRFLLKKLIITNFFCFTLILWHAKLNNILIDNFFPSFEFLFINNIYFFNLTFLLIIELIYYFWSYISFKNNLSDWAVKVPSLSDFSPLIKILIFYMLAFLYYSILE